MRFVCVRKKGEQRTKNKMKMKDSRSFLEYRIDSNDWWLLRSLNPNDDDCLS